MNYRKLGKTGIHVSEISLGTWQLGGEWGHKFDEKSGKALLHEAIDQGVNFLDTADKYGDGYSEKLVGEVIRERSDKVYIGTKCGRKLQPHVPDGYNEENIREWVEASLKNTGLEMLDLVQLHCPPTEVYNKDEVFEALEGLKQEGKISHYGVSVEQVKEAQMASKYGIETVQIIFNMFRQKPSDELLAELADKDIGVIVRVPLASGLLSGKMTAFSSFDDSDHRKFNRHGEAFDVGETFAGVDFDTGLKAVDELKSIFKTDKELYKYALKWILMHDQVSCIIPGASSIDQAKSNISVSDMPDLSQQEMEAVKEVYNKHIRPVVHDKW